MEITGNILSGEIDSIAWPKDGRNINRTSIIIGTLDFNKKTLDGDCIGIEIDERREDTMPVGIDWTPAATNEDAFEAEYIRIQDHGGPASRYDNATDYNYNKIQSHGEKIYMRRHGGETYDRTEPEILGKND